MTGRHPQTWQIAGVAMVILSQGDANLSWWYTLTDLPYTNGRYVQIQVKPGSNAGWTFIDEIEARQ